MFKKVSARSTPRIMTWSVKDWRTRLKSAIEYFLLPYDNRLSRKMFDSFTTLREEIERQRALQYLIIHPCSRLKVHWDLVIVTVLAVNLLVLPIEQAFFHRYTLQPGWLAFNAVSSIFYFIDILVSLFAGTVMPDSVCLDRREVMCRYLKGWFLIDLLGTLPFDLIFRAFGRVNRNSTLCEIGRSAGLLKLLRMPSLIRHLKLWQDIFFNSTRRVYVKLINVLLSMLLLCHFNACLLFFVPMMHQFPEKSWVTIAGIGDDPWYRQYMWSFFGAISIMIGIGFGKANPEALDEVILVCFVLISGAIGYGVLLANGTALVQNLNHSRTAHEQIMAEVKQYMRYKKLPKALQKRVADFFENRFKGNYFEEDRIIAEMSEVLREDVLRHNCRALVRQVPFFADADGHVVGDVIRRLRSEFYQPGDEICAAGSVGTRMFFLQSGNVAVTLKDGAVVAHLKDGSYFGEMCLLHQEKRNASVIAEAYCTLYTLATEDFNEILEQYPLLRRSMEEIAEIRCIQNRQLEARTAIERAYQLGFDIERF